MNQYIKKPLKALYKFIKGKPSYQDYVLKDIDPISPVESKSNKPRLNLVITSMNKKDIYAGIKTAVDFFLGLKKYMEIEGRIIVLNGSINKKDVYLPEGFSLFNSLKKNSDYIISLKNRNENLSIRENDIFITTMWYTTYCILDLNKWFENTFKKDLKIIYLIQDYEPGFYPWSSKFLLAESTYKSNLPLIAVFNSKSLFDYFNKKGYKFEKSYYFDPVLNNNIKKHLNIKLPWLQRKNQILIYGRPRKARNCFEIIAMGLNKWYQEYPEAKKFKILSAGQNFPSIQFPSGLKIINLGKLSIEEYAKIMSETKVGISLMSSPHPSYPPLEMVTFGIKVITNDFATKDLSGFSKNIISLEKVDIDTVAEAIHQAVNSSENFDDIPPNYLKDNTNNFEEIYENIKNYLKI